MPQFGGLCSVTHRSASKLSFHAATLITAGGQASGIHTTEYTLMYQKSCSQEWRVSVWGCRRTAAGCKQRGIGSPPDTTFWVVFQMGVPFWIPKMVRHPHKKDPKRDHELENFPFLRRSIRYSGAPNSRCLGLRLRFCKPRSEQIDGERPAIQNTGVQIHTKNIPL